jgi:heptosyltransferase-2
MRDNPKILIIQTAFIGDVILATPVVEALKQALPGAVIDFLVRKGNEPLLKNHPKINQLIIWDKKKLKYRNLFRILKQLRKNKYDLVINLQRFGATGLLTAFSKARIKVGFNKNPFSFLFTFRVKHRLGDFVHETERNLDLLEPIIGKQKANMALYPDAEAIESMKKYQMVEYLCIAPTSVWFTKQFPAEKWVEFLNKISGYTVYLLGANSDWAACKHIIEASTNRQVVNLCGQLNLLQSAVLMKGAAMNFVNDSAPMHLASAMNAPVTALFCSTIPAFGFGPLSYNARVIETDEQLPCRPCGLHGFKSCPEGHFKCGTLINVDKLVEAIGRVSS